MIQELLQPELLAFLGEGLLTTMYIAVASIILSLIFVRCWELPGFPTMLYLGRWQWFILRRSGTPPCCCSF